MATSIRAQCSARLKEILRNKLFQEASFEDEFDLIETKLWGMIEQVNVGVYIKNLDKDEAYVLTMQVQILFAAKL